MYTRDDVLDALGEHGSDLPSGVKAFAESMADVANVYLNQVGQQAMDSAMALLLAICNLTRNTTDSQALFQSYTAELNDALSLSQTPGGVSQVQWMARAITPRPPPPPPSDPSVPGHLRTIRGMRTRETDRSGVRLAQTARQLLGNFRWMARGPEGIAPVGRALTRDHGGSNVHGFDMWIRKGGAFPRGDTILNCWESVLVTAHEAGLLSSGRIRAVYERAATQARRSAGPSIGQMHRTNLISPQLATALNKAYDDYTQALDDGFFRSNQAVPVKVEAGLIPRAGDILFTNNGMADHVCIALGRRWANGKPIDEAASLWFHYGGKFSLVTLSELLFTAQRLSYRPCVF